MAAKQDLQEVAIGRRRAAIALVALGEDRASAVLSALGEAEAAEVAGEVMKLGPVSAEEITQALAYLGQQMDTIHASTAPGEPFTRGILSRAFGPATAGRILEDLTRPARFEWLATADADVASRVLAAEPPSTIALALAHLDAKAAARLLTRLPEPVRADVALRVAHLDAVDSDTVETVDLALRERVGTTLRAQVNRVSGTDILAEMLSASPRSAEESLVSHLEGTDPDLAGRVRAAMFRFEDLTLLTSRDLQKVLSQVEIGDLARSVYGARQEVSETIMSNVSERARANLEEEISFLQNLRPTEVRAAQENIMQVVRRLDAEGEIQIPRPGDDEEDA